MVYTEHNNPSFHMRIHAKAFTFVAYFPYAHMIASAAASVQERKKTRTKVQMKTKFCRLPLDV